MDMTASHKGPEALQSFPSTTSGYERRAVLIYVSLAGNPGDIRKLSVLQSVVTTCLAVFS